MEKPRFTISADLDRKLMHVVMRGFWNADTIAAYDKEVRQVADEMDRGGCPRAELVALVDLRELDVQTQTMIAEYKDKFDAPGRRPRRLAAVVSSALLKRQVERVAIPNQRIFADERSAMEWLLS